MNDPLLQVAWRAHQSGDLAEAARLYGEILRHDPRHFDALYGLGVLHYARGDFAEAERLLARAAERNPRLPEPWFTRACALQRMGKGAGALTLLDRALAIRPAYPEALINKGSILMGMHCLDEALASFDAAAALNPNMPEVWNNRGNALSELGRYEEAVASYDRVLRLRPGIAETLMNRGTALMGLKRFSEAHSSYDEAIRADTNSASAFSGRANALFEMKRYEDAAGDYASALRLDPDCEYAAGNLAFCRLQCCDWHDLEENRAKVSADLRARKRAVNPFQNLALARSEDEQLRSATLWMEDKFPGAARNPWHGERYRHDKIRIAYISADFNQHAVSTQMAGIFEHHDRQRFETVAFSLGPSDGSSMRARLMRAFGCFLDADRQPDAEIAQTLRKLEIDIAVDLMGFTGECRPGILGPRPAPLQVNYLGFPGTMGASHIDYLIADRIVIPETSTRCYTEAVAYLPDSYFPNDSTRAIAEPAPTRSEAGLPERGFVFASFNNSYKFAPETFDVWMRLLHAVPQSILWLAKPNETAARNLLHEAEVRGIAPARIVFAPFAAHAEDHLARLKLAGIFLDTLPYNAHSTACDALWAGVPVVTCLGSTFAGRVGASLLNALGLPELIAPSLPAYEAIALKLARDASALAALRTKLESNRRTYPLFDTDRFTRSLEGLYLEMWLRQQQGLPAEQIG